MGHSGLHVYDHLRIYQWRHRLLMVGLVIFWWFGIWIFPDVSEIITGVLSPGTRTTNLPTTSWPSAQPKLVNCVRRPLAARPNRNRTHTRIGKWMNFGQVMKNHPVSCRLIQVFHPKLHAQQMFDVHTGGIHRCCTCVRLNCVLWTPGGWCVFFPLSFIYWGINRNN